MLRLLKFLLADQKRAKLQRLTSLAAQMDEVLMSRTLCTETRSVLQSKREQLEDQIHELSMA